MPRDEDGDTPLHWAAWQRNPRVIRVLLDAGAKMSVGNNTGSSPLHYAARYAATEVGRLLIAAGAEVSDQNNDGRTPLELAEREENEELAALLRNPRRPIGGPGDRVDVGAPDAVQIVRSSRTLPTDSVISTRSVIITNPTNDNDSNGVVVSFSGEWESGRMEYYLPVSHLELARLHEHRFFPDHRLQLYSVESRRGVANVYYHYLIRNGDQFYYMGILPDMSFDADRNRFFSSERMNAVCHVTTDYELRDYRFHVTGTVNSEGCRRL